MNDIWEFPHSLAISRSWKDVDAFCNYLLTSPNASSGSKALFIDVGTKQSLKGRLDACASLPFEYIVFGTLDAMILILHGYPKQSPEMATFRKVLKHGQISKLYWSEHESNSTSSPYAMMTGKELGKAWCNLEIFFKMLDVKPVANRNPLPESLLSLITHENVEMWKRSTPSYSSPKLLLTTSKVSAMDLQDSLSVLFSRIALFRSVIRDPQPDLLWMSEEDEREFSNYYLNEKEGKLAK